MSGNNFYHFKPLRGSGKTELRREQVYEALIDILQDPNLKSIVINGVAINFTWYSFNKERTHLFLSDENEKRIASVFLPSITSIY